MGKWSDWFFRSTGYRAAAAAFALALTALPLCGITATGVVQGWAQKGGVRGVGGYFLTSNLLMGSYPGARIDVYQTGTTTPLTIYSDTGGTVAPNPQFADSNAFFRFFTLDQQVDLKFSGGGLAVPVTITYFTAPVIGGTSLTTAGADVRYLKLDGTNTFTGAALPMLVSGTGAAQLKTQNGSKTWYTGIASTGANDYCIGNTTGDCSTFKIDGSTSDISSNRAITAGALTGTSAGIAVLGSSSAGSSARFLSSSAANTLDTLQIWEGPIGGAGQAANTKLTAWYNKNSVLVASVDKEGDVTGHDCAFSGALTGVTGAFSGALSATTGTFTGNVSGVDATFTGNGAVTGTLTSTGILSGPTAATGTNTTQCATTAFAQRDFLRKDASNGPVTGALTFSAAITPSGGITGPVTLTDTTASTYSFTANSNNAAITGGAVRGLLTSAASGAAGVFGSTAVANTAGVYGFCTASAGCTGGWFTTNAKDNLALLVNNNGGTGTGGTGGGINASANGGYSGKFSAGTNTNTQSTLIIQDNGQAAGTKMWDVQSIGGATLASADNAGLVTGTAVTASTGDVKSTAGDLVASGAAKGVKAYNRSVREGEWTAVTYNAANFTASAGTWTVDAGDQTTFAYTLHGKTITVSWVLVTTSVSVTPATLSIAIPGGFTATKTMYAPMGVYSDNAATAAAGFASVTAGATTISLTKFTGNWSAAVNTSAFYGQITFEIN